jgi:hypothetical protein
MFRLGYVSAGAVPLTLESMSVVVQVALQVAWGEEYGSVEYALAWRDVCMYQYLWETLQRGFEAGVVQVTDFSIGDLGVTGAWEAVMSGELAVGVKVNVESSAGTKTRKTARPGAVVLEVTPGGLLQSFALYAAACVACGCPIWGFVFRPQLAGRGAFKEVVTTFLEIENLWSC